MKKPELNLEITLVVQLHCIVVQSSILMKLNFILKGLSQSCFGPGCLYEFSRGDSIPKCDLV